MHNKDSPPTVFFSFTLLILKVGPTSINGQKFKHVGQHFNVLILFYQSQVVAILIPGEVLFCAGQGISGMVSKV